MFVYQPKLIQRKLKFIKYLGLNKLVCLDLMAMLAIVMMYTTFIY